MYDNIQINLYEIFFSTFQGNGDRWIDCGPMDAEKEQKLQEYNKKVGQ